MSATARATVETEPIKVRAVVARFAQAMEEKLRQNDAKGGWEDESAHWLLERLHEETAELEKALEGPHYAEEAKARIRREAADVANFALMIADSTGGLGDYARGNGTREPAVYLMSEDSGATIEAQLRAERDDAVGRAEHAEQDAADLVEKIEACCRMLGIDPVKYPHGPFTLTEALRERLRKEQAVQAAVRGLATVVGVR